MLIGIATLLILLCGGHSSSVAVDYHKTEDLIKKYVTDDARKKQALQIVKEMEKTAAESAKEREKAIDSVQKLLDVRTTATDQIETTLQPVIDTDKVTSEELLDLKFQLKHVLTAQEWGKVFPVPTTQP